MNDDRLDLDEYLHELLAEAQAVNDMADTDGWQHVVNVCNRMLYKVGDQILSGRVTDPMEYTRQTAFREGVLFVLGAVERVNRNVREARDQVRELREVSEEDAA